LIQGCLDGLNLQHTVGKNFPFESCHKCLEHPCDST
jgi:hypothetical protein